MDREGIDALREVLTKIKVIRGAKQELLDQMERPDDLMDECEATITAMARWLNDGCVDPDTHATDCVHYTATLALCLLTMRQVYGIGGKNFQRAKSNLSREVEELSTMAENFGKLLPAGETDGDDGDPCPENIS